MKRIRNRRRKKCFVARIRAYFLLAVLFSAFVGNACFEETVCYAREKVITLRVCNWEEYIDLGHWDDGELIELENGTEIFGENSMIEDFETWYYETYGERVKVEYSCAGTNEDLYNQLTLGDSYDLICPSEYMIMKLMAEGKLQPYSDEFFDVAKEENYYVKGVSPYIRDTFEKNRIKGEAWSKYAACYMWGVTGILYNPEYMTNEEAATWSVFENPKFYRKVTLKDNVRDTYFAAMGSLRRDLLMSEEFQRQSDYEEQLAAVMNDVDPATIQEIESALQNTMKNIYALETDSGKADMITGKIVGNYQWSGDAVYAMDQAEEDEVFLEFAVPEECTNLWFDGWVMLEDGIANDDRKQHAAEAFVNFLSRPDNVVRNMYYIGYTSAISGGEDETVFDYVTYCYGADEEEEETVSYPIGYFFTGDNTDAQYVITTTKDQLNRQLFSQYPSQGVIERCAIMGYFDDDTTKRVNQMWINIRCFHLKDTPVAVWIISGIGAVLLLFLAGRSLVRRIQSHV